MLLFTATVDGEHHELVNGMKDELRPSLYTLTHGESEVMPEKEFTVSDVSWYLDHCEAFEAEVQIRYRHRAVDSVVTPLPGGRARIQMSMPQHAVAPGQSAVFYKDDCIIGGGWIE